MKSFYGQMRLAAVIYEFNNDILVYDKLHKIYKGNFFRLMDN